VSSGVGDAAVDSTTLDPRIRGDDDGEVVVPAYVVVPADSVVVPADFIVVPAAYVVVPAKAGTQCLRALAMRRWTQRRWIPAFAGMTTGKDFAVTTLDPRWSLPPRSLTPRTAVRDRGGAAESVRAPSPQ